MNFNFTKNIALSTERRKRNRNEGEIAMVLIGGKRGAFGGRRKVKFKNRNASEEDFRYFDSDAIKCEFKSH